MFNILPVPIRKEVRTVFLCLPTADARKQFAVIESCKSCLFRLSVTMKVVY